MQQPVPTTLPEKLTLPSLRRALRRVDPSALLVEPRILRRVIRLDRHVAGLAFMVPHRKGYTIERDRLLVFVNLAELELPPGSELPETVILLVKPTDEEALGLVDASEALHRYWRLLFHARVHVELARRVAEDPPTEDLAALRKAQIGGAEFAEAREVLLKDGFLFPEPGDQDVYVEFAAVFLELHYFAREQLPLTFPAVRSWPEIERIVSQDLDHAQLWETTRLEGAPQQLEPAADPPARGEEVLGAGASPAAAVQREPAPLDSEADPRVAARAAALRGSASQCARLEGLADRAAAEGNGVRAAILRWRAATIAPPHLAAELRDTAGHELRQVVLRLQGALQLSDAEVDAWVDALQPLLGPAIRWIWSLEARLLNDLQRVCFEHERGVFKIAFLPWCRMLLARTTGRMFPPKLVALLGKWWRALVVRPLGSLASRSGIASAGQACRRYVLGPLGRVLPIKFFASIGGWHRGRLARPVRRSQPLLREVLVNRHLRKADRRLMRIRMSDEPRHRLSSLLAAALHRVEANLRARFRPLIVGVLDEVGLVPRNVPERVARRKLVEEMLDRIVEHGFANMGDLRDALSRGDLKLFDVSDALQVLRGDRLLRADRKLEAALDGVYRGGAIYQRWPHRLSSIAFGTPNGRFITQYIALPYGGAYLALEGIKHIILLILGRRHVVPEEITAQIDIPETSHLHFGPTHWWFYALVLLLGTWLLLLMHRPRFRAWCLELVHRFGRMVRWVFYDLPTGLIRSPLVQRVLTSPVYVTVRDYVLRPALLTSLFWLVAYCIRHPMGLGGATYVYLLFALFLNSALGRFADEWFTDLTARVLYEFRMRILATAFQWIMDAFHRLMVTMERLVFTVDDLLRFRVGDKRLAEGVKLVSGAVWYVVSYIFLFVFTLLIEPQINPIKHFPVVTVSHKLLWPTSGFFLGQLSPYFGKAWAGAIVTVSIFLIPGIPGFLVWELTANWRLYAANRPKTLVPVPVGHHNETMTRLLRPGFHSGTLPKLYAALRRAARKARHTGNTQPLVRRRNALLDVADAIRHFSERELLALLGEAPFLPGVTVQVGNIRMATNRLEVELQRADHPRHPAWLIWEEDAGRLVAAVGRTGWLDALSPGDRETFAAALSGICQRSGVEAARGAMTLTVSPPMNWSDWVARWSPVAPNA